MNRLALLLITIILSSNLFSQTEFQTYDNGLIYSETTMNKLGEIVDSLNLKYKNCDLSKVFKSKSQTIGHKVSLESKDVLQAKKDMDENITFESFLAKYPKAKVEMNVLIVKSQYENYQDEQVVEFREIELQHDYGMEVSEINQDGLYNKALKNSWLYDYYEKSSYSEESIQAFFFPEEFKTHPLDQKYSRQIGYADCLIDTLTTKFKEGSKSGWVALPENWQDISTKKQKKLLDEMRSIHVYGGCSQDSRPRVHAINIALLSAETTNWEVFLKSHLDIMNDRFDRMSDGSYAWAHRKTYIKELEELDINVLDLLIGISLRIENPGSNHYYGSIGRLGRAISESNNKERFESQMISMIEDDNLDDYNRVLSYFLFINYNHYIEDAQEKRQNQNRLEASIEKLPKYLSEKIVFDQD